MASRTFTAGRLPPNLAEQPPAKSRKPSIGCIMNSNHPHRTHPVVAGRTHVRPNRGGCAPQTPKRLLAVLGRYRRGVPSVAARDDAPGIPDTSMACQNRSRCWCESSQGTQANLQRLPGRTARAMTMSLWSISMTSWFTGSTALCKISDRLTNKTGQAAGRLVAHCLSNLNFKTTN